MTSQNSITDKKSVGFMPFFGFSTKQFWTTILLFTIILFFVLPVPILMIISDRDVMTAEEIIRLKNDIGEEWVSGVRYAVIPILSVFGIVLSCSRFKYLKSKVSVDFYHSLPIKRGRLFLTQLGVGAIAVAIPYLFNVIFALTVIGSNGLISQMLIVNSLIMTAETFIYTLFFFSLSTLVGMSCGLTAVQLTLTAVAIFIVPAVYITVLGYINIFNENMWFSFYANTSLFEKLSPVFRFIFNAEPVGALEAILMLIISAAILVLAYFVYMGRKSERAGTPVVFPILGEVIKYILVFLGTLLGGMLFYYIMDSYFWTVFGMICGMVLVFMLTNTILNKTARAMFKGWKGLLVFAVCAAVMFTVLVNNAFGINTRIPAPENTARVVVNFDETSGEMEFRDKAVIEALENIYNNSLWDKQYEYGNPTYWYDYMYVEIVFYPKLGIPNAKTVRVYNKNELVEDFRTILDSEEFKAQYAAVFDKLEDSRGYMYVNRINYIFNADGTVTSDTSGNGSWDFDNFNISDNVANMFGLTLIAEENKACGFDYFQQPQFGRVYATLYNKNEAIRLPLFNSMNTLVEHYIETDWLSQTPEETIEKLTEIIDEIVVYKAGEVNKLSIKDKTQIKELLSSATNPFGDEHSVYTFVETDYYAEYILNISDNYDIEYYYDEYGNRNTVKVPRDIEDIRTYEEPVRLAFLLGKIPEFVTDALG